MFKLEKRGPIRVVLVAGSGKAPDVAVICAPITPAMRRRAFRKWQARLDAEGIADLAAADPDLLGDLNEMLSRELMRMGVVEWSGIADEDGQALELTPDQATRLRTVNDPDRATGSIDDLLANDEIFRLLDDNYIRPEGVRFAEKNGLSASPNGTSAAATRASATASSRARPKAKTNGAANVRTGRTRSKPGKPKRSGKS